MSVQYKHTIGLTLHVICELSNSKGEMTKKDVMVSLSNHGAQGIANYALAVMPVV
jgi:hypothetical protein